MIELINLRISLTSNHECVLWIELNNEINIGIGLSLRAPSHVLLHLLSEILVLEALVAETSATFSHQCF